MPIPTPKSTNDSASGGAGQTTAILIEDHPLFRDALLQVLNSSQEFVVVGAYGSATALWDSPPKSPPLLVLVDLLLPDGDGVLLVKEFARRFPEARAVILTAYTDEWNLERARNAGVWAFIGKTTEPETILSTLRTVAGGQKVFPRQRSVSPSARGELQNTSRFASPTRIFQLSAREREVARLLAAGCSNQDIAHTLYISHGTVKLHVSSIYEKLQLHERSQAIVYLLEHKNLL